MNKQRIGILIAASLGALATFLPWVNVPIMGAINGTKGDGWITFGLYLIPIIISLFGNTAKSLNTGMLLGAIIPSLIAVVIGIWKIVDFKSIMSDASTEDNPFLNSLGQAISIGFGLYLVIIAGIVITIIGFAVKDYLTYPNEQ